MQYLLLISVDEQALGKIKWEERDAESVPLTQRLQSHAQRLAAKTLDPTSTATRVRVRRGQPLITDGPFAETREQLGG